MTRTLALAKGTPVFISGHNGTDSPWEDMDGYVALVSTADMTVTVHWDHPALAHSPLMRYGAERLVETTDRNGVTWLIVNLPVG